MYFSDLRGIHMDTPLFFPVNDPFDTAYRKNKPKVPVGPHIHNAVEIYYTLTDLPDVLIEDKIFEVPADTLIIIPPYLIHQLYHESGIRYERYIISISDSWIKNVFGAESLSFSWLYERSAPIFISFGGKEKNKKNELTNSLRKLISYKGDLSPEKLVLFFNFLSSVSSLAKAGTKRNKTLHISSSQKRVNEMIAYIQQHSSENLTLTGLAEHFHLNTDYLARLFKQHVHISPGRYMIIQKINKAQEMLRSGESVSQVSDNLGFTDYSHFFKSFKKITGVSPSKYRDLYS